LVGSSLGDATSFGEVTSFLEESAFFLAALAGFCLAALEGFFFFSQTCFDRLEGKLFYT